MNYFVSHLLDLIIYKPYSSEHHHLYHISNNTTFITMSSYCNQTKPLLKITQKRRKTCDIMLEKVSVTCNLDLVELRRNIEEITKMKADLISSINDGVKSNRPFGDISEEETKNTVSRDNNVVAI